MRHNANKDFAFGPDSRMESWTTRGDGIDNLVRRRMPAPQPDHGQVLVQISAVSLNYRDLLVIDGVDDWRPPADVVPISDGVGTIVATGPGVTRWTIGDRVSAMFLPKWHTGPLKRDLYVNPVGGPVNPGMLADLVVVDQNDVARPPRSLTDVEAATLPVAAITAWHAIAVRSRVQAGDTVLIHGTGGVALFALQFAVALSARVIITSSSDAKLAKARRLGAAKTLNYRTETDITQSVLDSTSQDGVDHVIETIGGDNLNQSLRVVKVGGTIAFIGLIAGKTAEINTYEFVTKNVTLHGIETGSRAMYEQMADFIDDHSIRPVVDSVFARAEIHKALAHLRDGGHLGKIVLTEH